MAMVDVLILRRGRVRIASTHTAGAGAHAANTDWPRVGQLLHDFGPGDVELRAIDLPAITRRHVTQGLRVELPGKRGDAELLHCLGDRTSSAWRHSRD